MQFESVPVPTKWVTKVYAYIAGLEAEESGADDGDGETPPEADEEWSNGDWPEEDLARFIDGETAMHPTVIGMLDLLADQPGTQVPLSKVASHLDVSKHVLRGRLSALTRHLRANYDFDTLGWPMQWEFHLNADGSQETHYYISTEQAQRWRRVRQR